MKSTYKKNYTNRSTLFAILIFGFVLSVMTVTYRVMMRTIQAHPGKTLTFKSGKLYLDDGELTLSYFAQLNLSDFMWQFLVGFLVVLIFFIIQKWSINEFLGIKNSFSKKNLLYLFVSLLIIFLSGKLLATTEDDGITMMLRLINQYSTLKLILILGVLIPIIEEIYFRKILYDFSNMTIKNWSPWIGILVSFIFFIILHTQYSVASLIVITIISAILSYGRYYTNGIVIPILIHIISNSAAILLN